MPFLFVYLCDLLNDLERPYLRATPLLPRDLEKYTKDKVIYWLGRHRDALNAFSTDSRAVMSMLQPETQTDRVYGLDPESLELVIARVLGLSRRHYQDLQRWQTEPLRGDLAACVNGVMENAKIVSCCDSTVSFTMSQINPRTFVDNRASSLSTWIIPEV
jgi:hypothetical protein